MVRAKGLYLAHLWQEPRSDTSDPTNQSCTALGFAEKSEGQALVMTTSQQRDWRSQGKLVASALALGILLIFIALNFEKVDVDLVIGTQNIQLAFALIFAAVLGFIAGYFAPRVRLTTKRD